MLSSSNQYRIVHVYIRIVRTFVYGITFVYLSIIVRISFEYCVNENFNGTVSEKRFTRYQ